VAVRVTTVAVFTLAVVTTNVAVVEPCATVTVAGTPAAAAFELESVITMPPAPAGPVRLRVPLPDCPAMMTVGLTEMPLRAGDAEGAGGAGVMVRPKVAVTPR